VAAVRESSRASRSAARPAEGNLRTYFLQGESTTLADLVGITAQNLAVLKTGPSRAIRSSALERLCEVLECGPGIGWGMSKELLRIWQQRNPSSLSLP